MSKLSITLEIDNIDALKALEQALELWVDMEQERLKSEPDALHAPIVAAGERLLSQVQSGRG